MQLHFCALDLKTEQGSSLWVKCMELVLSSIAALSDNNNPLKKPKLCCMAFRIDGVLANRHASTEPIHFPMQQHVHTDMTEAAI